MSTPTATTKQPFVARHGDSILALGLTGVLVALIIPLPPMLLDILLTFNLSYVLLLMMVVLGVSTPLDLSTFPSLLLIGTLFRLALNVASTRLILLEAYAGNVIESFGQFVVGGEVVVGLVIFAILVVIQYIVITKGAERISEVTARFTLDSMPGKQMSIDADLNAGVIDMEEARERRMTVVRESDFYGAMDGATKYVRGDAIAGIVIVFINLVGGIVIGLSRGMTVGGAIKTYSLLTVGDGLVTQIPAVIMSTAAGILVTKSASEEALSRELGLQVFRNNRAIGVAAVILFLFMLMPGLPALPFFALGALLAGVYWKGRRREKLQAAAAEPTPEEEKQKALKESEDETVQSLLAPDRVSVEVGYNLIQLIDPQKGGGLLERIKSLRKKFARELGVVVPKIRILDNVELEANRYRINLSGHRVAEGEIYPGRMMAMKPDGEPEGLRGVKTKEPSFGMPVVWIGKGERENAETQGCTLVDPESVFITHLSEVIRRHAHEILNRQDVKQLIDNVREENPAVIEELVPDVIGTGQVQQVLENLLAEGIPINNLSQILEKAGAGAQQVSDPAMLTEMVRKGLPRAICSRFMDKEGNVRALALDPRLEEEIRESLEKLNGDPRVMKMAPTRLRQIMTAISEQAAGAFDGGGELAIITNASIRPYVRDIASRVSSDIPVISFDELCDTVNLQIVGMINIPEAQLGGGEQAETIRQQEVSQEA